MSTPLVSIIIPTYNRLSYLKELMEAFRKQTFQDFEVIIVNDCGENIDILKDLYKSLHIRILHLKENVKQVQARNEGVQLARGEWIMLMDDDDLIVPTHLERMVKEREGYDLLYSDVEIVDHEITEQGRRPKSRRLFAYHFNLEAMRKFSTFVPSGCLYRRALHDTVGYFDTNVHNYWDWDFFLRVAENHRIKRVPSAGVLYDFSESNDNQSKNLDARKFYLDRLCQKHNLGELPSENFFTLLTKPEIKEREAESEILWDGKLFWCLAPPEKS